MRHCFIILAIGFIVACGPAKYEITPPATQVDGDQGAGPEDKDQQFFFEIDKGRVDINELVTANATCTLKGDTVEITWNLGDGRTEIGAEITFVYSEEGVYTVSAVCENESGTTLTQRADITVLPPEGPEDQDTKSGAIQSGS